jgi:CRP-like cAMP-binding protein
VNVSTPQADRAVHRLDVFRQTPPEAVDALLADAEQVRFAPDDVLFRQGEPLGGAAVLLLSGRLTVSVESGGARRNMADVWPGEFVGEGALFSRGAVRTATVTAAAPSHGLKITRDMLARNVGQPAVVALEQHLVATMARRITATQKTLQRVMQEQQAVTAPAAYLSTPIARPSAPRSESPTLVQRLARWFNGET